MPGRRGRAAVDSTQGLRWRRALRTAAVLIAAAAALAAATGVHAAGPASSTATSAASAASGATTVTVTTTTPAAPSSRLTDAQATKILLAYPKVASWLHRYSSGVTTSATLTAGVWQVNVFYGPAGEIASGKVNDATGQVTDAFTGPQVAWGMARGGNGFGGKKINEWQIWLIFCVAFLRRARRLAAALLAQNSRPTGAPLVLALALVLQPRPDLRGDLPGVSRLRLADRPLPLDRASRPRLPRLRRVADLGARGGHALPRRLPDRPEHQPLERHRRRAFGGDRRRPDRAVPGSLRQLPGRGRQAQLRPGGRVGRGPRPHPDERPLRGGRSAGRHVRPGGLPRLRAGLHLPRLERPLGFVTDGSLHHDPVGPAGDHRAVVRRGAVRRPATRRRVLVRVGGMAVHAVLVELQHERPDRTGPTHLGLLLPHLAGQTRAVHGVLGVDEVRFARRGSALVRLPGRPGVAAAVTLRLGLPRRHRPVVRDPALRPIAGARGPGLLRPHLRVSVRPRVAVLALGLAPVPREGAAEPPLGPAGALRGARSRLDRARVVAATEEPAPHGRVHRARCSSASSRC